MISENDMRRSPRVDVDRLVVGLADGDRLARGNVSYGGVGLELDGHVAVGVGDPVVVRLDLPETGEQLSFSAIVRHASHRNGVFYVGACFVDLDPLTRNPLERFVEEAQLLATTGPLPLVDAPSE